MRTNSPQVRLTDVSKRYNSDIVLANANLEIRTGEFIVIIGRSGSGKSTLLNLIGGLDSPSSGKIEILGHSLTDLTEEQQAKIRCQNLGFVFQFFNLIPTLTVTENICLPMALNGISKEASRIRAGELLRELGT